uniref:Uncharacterized protein n=1 Tax=Babesia bovis TaxID=5865 RepID=S6C795_BABBO|nr:hypothetical protein [Babesia bovis]
MRPIDHGELLLHYNRICGIYGDEMKCRHFQQARHQAWPSCNYIQNINDDLGTHDQRINNADHHRHGPLNNLIGPP